MHTLAEAAMDLPWLAPSVASLLSLARSQVPSAWHDPGMVLLSAQLFESTPPSDIALLEAALKHHEHFHLGFVDWGQPSPDAVHRACCRQAELASRLADKIGSDGRRTGTAGFLAPLGWLTIVAVDQKAAGLDTVDYSALTRRLCRNWRLPAWLTSIIGNLGLHADVAERLGAEPTLFRLVQLSVLLLQERGQGLGLIIGGDVTELLEALNLKATDVDAVLDEVLAAPVPKQEWEAPAKHPLLADLLRLALENRRSREVDWIERLQQDVDRLHEVIANQTLEEKQRLQASKLSALAEFAAGAGHEINNPLAVISGQAQYVLKQMEWLDVSAEDIEDIGAYLAGVREKMEPSLEKIISQTQRVHAILTDLMKFARPTPPRLQTVPAHQLIVEAIESLRALAQERKIRIVAEPSKHDEYLHVDPNQARSALARLLRNAVEAASPDGWAGVRIEKNADGMIDFIVEDNGGGPAAGIREHLFDPFFSGRSARPRPRPGVAHRLAPRPATRRRPALRRRDPENHPLCPDPAARSGASPPRHRLPHRPGRVQQHAGNGCEKLKHP
jgi:signal transduction histidine kinase